MPQPNAQRIYEAAILIGRPNDTFHTYAKWQELGYQVQKGEKATLKVKLWIPAKGNSKNVQSDEKSKDTEREDGSDKKTRFILKSSNLFGAEQVRPVTEENQTQPEEGEQKTA